MTSAKEFTLSHEELSSKEMVYIACTILESRGYQGFTQLLQIVDDPTIILKIIRFLYGMEIKVPPLKEFINCLRAAEYTFCDMHKKIHVNLCAKPVDIRNFMGITEEEEKELLQIFDEWCTFMHKNGIDLTNIMHINRNNTKKRIKMNAIGKKWTKKLY